MSKPEIVQSTQPACGRCGVPYRAHRPVKMLDDVDGPARIVKGHVWLPQCSCWTAAARTQCGWCGKMDVDDSHPDCESRPHSVDIHGLPASPRCSCWTAQPQLAVEIEGAASLAISRATSRTVIEAARMKGTASCNVAGCLGYCGICSPSVVPAPPEKQPETYSCLLCGTTTLYPHRCPQFNPPHLASPPVEKPSVAPSPAPAEPYEGLTESELVHIAVIERAERKRLETLPREVAKCRGHWHMMSCGDDLAYGGDVDIGSFSSAEAAMAGWDRYYEEESHILWLCEKLRALRSRAQSLPPEGEK